MTICNAESRRFFTPSFDLDARRLKRVSAFAGPHSWEDVTALTLHAAHIFIHLFGKADNLPVLCCLLPLQKVPLEMLDYGP